MNKHAFIKIFLSTLYLSWSCAQAHDMDLDGLYSPDKLDVMDWDKAEHITLNFEDNVYSPDELTLKKISLTSSS